MTGVHMCNSYNCITYNSVCGYSITCVRITCITCNSVYGYSVTCVWLEYNSITYNSVCCYSITCVRITVCACNSVYGYSVTCNSVCCYSITCNSVWLEYNTHLNEAGFNFVKKCISVVEARAINTTGLYRIGGVNSKVQKLMNSVFSPKAPADMSLDPEIWDNKTITSGLKNYLRNITCVLCVFVCAIR
ncbi:hypothetical protein QTP86_009594 [Hemibagrus guttatus]|nr:hypothetical protein QTP86_009594 [Hemibagrus guttatus]